MDSIIFYSILGLDRSSRVPYQPILIPSYQPTRRSIRQNIGRENVSPYQRSSYILLFLLLLLLFLTLSLYLLLSPIYLYICRLFLRKIIRSIRSTVGKQFPIAVKLNSTDFLKGGFNENDSIEVLRIPFFIYHAHFLYSSY